MPANNRFCPATLLLELDGCPRWNDLMPSVLNPGPSSLYIQHPKSARLDDVTLVPGTSFDPVTVEKEVFFVYDHLDKPQTDADLTAAFLKDFGLGPTEASAEVGSLLQQMMEHGLVIEIPPGSPILTDLPGPTKRDRQSVMYGKRVN